MKIQMSTSAGINKAEIPKFEWFTYSGRKVVLDDHHKEYETEIRKGDVVGLRLLRGKHILVDAEDVSIKFTISKDERKQLLSKAKPYFGKVKGVKVVDIKKVKLFTKYHTALLQGESAATLRELTKKREVFEKGMTKADMVRAILKVDIKSTKKVSPVKPKPASTRTTRKSKEAPTKPKVNPDDLNPGVEVSVKFDMSMLQLSDKPVTLSCIVQEPPVGDQVRIKVKKYAKNKEFNPELAFFVPVSSVTKIAIKKEKTLTKAQKERKAYDDRYASTGVGGIARYKGKDYVVVEQTGSSRFFILVPIDEKQRLLKLKASADQIHALIKSKLSADKFKHYVDIYAERASELDPNSALSIERNLNKLREFDVQKGDEVGYLFKDQTVATKVKVLAIDWTKGRIAIKDANQKKWAPADRIEYKRSAGGVVDLSYIGKKSTVTKTELAAEAKEYFSKYSGAEFNIINRPKQLVIEYEISYRRNTASGALRQYKSTVDRSNKALEAFADQLPSAAPVARLDLMTKESAESTDEMREYNDGSAYSEYENAIGGSLTIDTSKLSA